jgi:hypothetical protein
MMKISSPKNGSDFIVITFIFLVIGKSEIMNVVRWQMAAWILELIG